MKTKLLPVKANVLIVDDDALFRESISLMLGETFACREAADTRSALKICLSKLVPDVVLLDYRLHKECGIDFCRQLHRNAYTRGIPVLFITAEDSQEVQVACWKAGASDFITKPVVCSTLIQRITHQLAVKQREAALEKQVLRDALTGVRNRQYLKQEVPSLIKQLRRDGDILSVLMVDIDDFKKYNDSLGHLKGDKCIQQVATALSSRANRPQDCVIRYGGEEFLVLLPKTDLRGAKRVAQDMCRTVENLFIEHNDTAYGVVTISVGVASSTNTRATKFGDLVHQADSALYKGKRCGKNCVVYNSSPKPRRQLDDQSTAMRWSMC